ncbi:PEP-CTERM sorting domain-containing protein [Planctomyces sp. SH-PL62]|uniref:PEP-CTERM sorting domain-containing protein n=1 Tax=Planctomyces sp. SH-PL62 TaxID=1636152 RepID=UPI00078C00D0|nr:PEP-CTERM sorting domain-containing protein [Planctomyces sp. SH-PL62]AMV39369.1 hypothetical protein VT85_18170 [Planctomyces sp. SH-PL62]
MDANSRTLRIQAHRRGRLALALGMVLLAFPLATAQAGPMRAKFSGRLAAQEFAPISASSPAYSNSWASFLSGGEPTWASRPSPPVTISVRQAVLRLINGDPSIAASSPLIGYMVWRRNLDVARFDFYHPHIGPRLPQGFIPPAPQVVPPLAPPSDIPSTPDDPPLLPPVPSVIPPVVPEPSAFLVIAMGTAGALWMRRRRAASASR